MLTKQLRRTIFEHSRSGSIPLHYLFYATKMKAMHEQPNSKMRLLVRVSCEWLRKCQMRRLRSPQSIPIGRGNAELLAEVAAE